MRLHKNVKKGKYVVVVVVVVVDDCFDKSGEVNNLSQTSGCVTDFLN